MPEKDVPLWIKLFSAVAVMATGAMASLRGVFVTHSKFETEQNKCQIAIRRDLQEIKEEQESHKSYLIVIAERLGIKNGDIPKI